MYLHECSCGLQVTTIHHHRQGRELDLDLHPREGCVLALARAEFISTFNRVLEVEVHKQGLVHQTLDGFVVLLDLQLQFGNLRSQ